MIAVGVLCALSAMAYAVGALVQQQMAGASWLTLVKAPRWWYANGCNAVGGLLHVVALRFGPLTLVQALGVGTLVLAVPLAARTARRQVTATEFTGVGLTTAGLAGLLALSGSSPEAALAPVELAVVIFAAMAALLMLTSLGNGRRHSGLWAAAAAGVAFGVASASTHTLGLSLSRPDGIALAGWFELSAGLSVAGFTVAGVMLAQRSFRGGLAGPLAVGAIANPVAAAVIGMSMLGEQFTLGAGGTLLAVVCAGCVIWGIGLLSVAHEAAGSLLSSSSYERRPLVGPASFGWPPDRPEGGRIRRPAA